MPGDWLGTCQPVLLMGGGQGGVGRAALHVPPVVAEAPPGAGAGEPARWRGYLFPSPAPTQWLETFWST